MFLTSALLGDRVDMWSLGLTSSAAAELPTVVVLLGKDLSVTENPTTIFQLNGVLNTSDLDTSDHFQLMKTQCSNFDL